MRRLLALVAALAMIGGAIAVRGAIDDDGKGAKDADPDLVLVCARDLEQVCEDLRETAGVRFVLRSTDEIAADPDLATYDGWLTFEPTARNSAVAPLLARPSEFSDPIGRSPLVLAVGRERGDVLASQCGGEVTWQCVGDVAGTRWQSIGGMGAWGDIKVGHADPETTGEGLAVIGQAASQFFGPDQRLSRDNFEEDAFLEWFTRLEGSVDLSNNAFERMLSTGSAEFDVVATLEAQAGPELEEAAPANQRRVRLLYPAPVATADIVYAPFLGGSDELADIVTGDDGKGALARAGYRVDGESSIPGVPDEPALPHSANLPAGDVLEALLETWQGVRG